MIRLENNQFDFTILSRAIAVTCVPLFVMLSGALLLGKKETSGTFFKKRFLRLIYPWVTWTIVYTIYETYTNHLHSLIQILRAFVTSFESFWFLPMIVGIYLLTPVTRILIQSAKKREILFIILLWFMAISFFPYTRDSMAFPRQVDDGLVRQVINYYGYFLLGYILSVSKLWKSWLLICISICIGFFWSIVNVYSLYASHSEKLVYEYFSYISPGIVFLSIGVFLLVFNMSGYIELKINNIGRNFLILLSTLALSIYFLHGLVQRLFLQIFGKSNLFHIYPSIDGFINAFVLFVVTSFILSLLYQIPIVKRVIA
jgi:surface polysaccharide O-acyltransferase-like enzyme